VPVAMPNLNHARAAKGRAGHLSTPMSDGIRLVRLELSVRAVKARVRRLGRKRDVKNAREKRSSKKKTRQEIHIEKGMPDKARIVLPGAGDQIPGVPAGDVIFVLRAQKHADFERAGSDLVTHVKITLSEALLGFSRILVTHLDGRGLQMSSPPGKILSTGHTIIIRGEGMPTYKQPDVKGNLYVVFEVEMPDENWLKTIDAQKLAALLPPKRTDVEPLPEIVDDVDFEESDIADFGEDEDDWVDDDDDDEDEDGYAGAEPECRPQ